MPGFIIHLVEATLLLKYMKKQPDAGWCQEFLLGNLLPDTRLGAEKMISHFWAPEHMDYIARAPKLERFLDKYGHRLDEPSILGYYSHLYLDEHYVDRYWPEILCFEDKEGHPEPRKALIDRVELREKGMKIPFDQFFTSEYYYGDYTRSNHWFVERYDIHPPKFKSLNVGMEEVDPEKLHCVLDELACICRKGKIGDEKEMKVFEPESLDEFIQRTAKTFYEEMARSGDI